MALHLSRVIYGISPLRSLWCRTDCAAVDEPCLPGGFTTVFLTAADVSGPLDHTSDHRIAIARNVSNGRSSGSWNKIATRRDEGAITQLSYHASEGHKTIGTWYTTLLNAHGNPIKHYGDLDIEMSRLKLDQAGAISRFIA